MEENKNNFVVICGLIGVLVVGLLLLFSRGGGKNTETGQSAAAEKFQSALTKEGVKRVGQPIEGFDASILKQAFPTLEDADFSGVDTASGEYVFEDEVLTYKRKEGGAISSAEQSISSGGYAELLENVAKRLGIAVTIESVDIIVATIFGTEEGNMPIGDGVPKVPPIGDEQEKVIYGTAASVEGIAGYKTDCASRGGTFNMCGSPCRQDSEICVTVCAYTCEFSKITSFNECVAAGNPVMESYPRQCRAGSELFVEKVAQPGSLGCTAEMRKGDVCTKIFKPVCAVVQIQCIRTPCSPVPESFSNACEACHNSLVSSYKEGACPGPNPS